MAPVTRHLAREHTPSMSQQWDNSLVHSTTKSAKIRKCLKLKSPDKQTSVPGPEHLHSLQLANQSKSSPAESSSDDMICTSPDSMPPGIDIEMLDPPCLALPKPQNPGGQLDQELHQDIEFYSLKAFHRQLTTSATTPFTHSLIINTCTGLNPSAGIKL